MLNVNHNSNTYLFQRAGRESSLSNQHCEGMISRQRFTEIVVSICSMLIRHPSRTTVPYLVN